MNINKLKNQNLATGAKSGSLAFALKILSVVLLLLNQIALARILGPDGMGQVLLALNIVYISSQIARFGMEDAMMRFVPMYIEHHDNSLLKGTISFALRSCFFISLIFILIIMMLSDLISIKIFHSQALVKLLPIASFAIIANAMRGVMGGILKGYKDTFKAVLPEYFISPFLRLVIFLLLSIMGGDPLFAIYAFVTGEICAVLFIGNFLLKRISNLRFVHQHSNNRKVLDVAVTMLLTGGLSIILFTQADLWIVGMFRSAEEVGIYGVVAKLVMLIILPLITFSTIIPPLIASIYTSGDINELRNLIRESTRWILSLSMPIILILTLEGDLILKIVFGEKFMSGYTALLILTIGQVINSASGLVGYLLQMTGGHRVIMIINIFWGALNILINILLVPVLGMTGAAISTSFCLAMGNITAVLVVYKRLSVITLAKGLEFDILFVATVFILCLLSVYNNLTIGKHVILSFALIIYIWKSLANHDLPWRIIIDRFKAT